MSIGHGVAIAGIWIGTGIGLLAFPNATIPVCALVATIFVTLLS